MNTPTDQQLAEWCYSARPPKTVIAFDSSNSESYSVVRTWDNYPKVIYPLWT